MQQQDAKLITNAVPTRNARSFEIIWRMLGTTVRMAIKKTDSR
jgi:hypothetical protein